MALDNTGMKREPAHPGAMLWEDFMGDFGLSVSALAEALGVSRHPVNDLIRERQALSPQMSLRLSRLFGNSAEFWLNAQQALDIWEAKQALSARLANHVGVCDPPLHWHHQWAQRLSACPPLASPRPQTTVMWW